MEKFVKKELKKISIWLLISVIILMLCIFLKISLSITISILLFVFNIFEIFLSKTWIEDYKLELNKESEEYKVKLSNYTLVTKLQYDLEFKIYTEIYEYIYEVFEIINCVGNQIDEGNFFDGTLEKSKLFNEKLQKYTIRYRPFYNKDIFLEISKLLIIINELQELYSGIKLQKDNNNKILEIIISTNLKNDFEENYNKFVEIYEALSDVIRKRIENMKIVEK